MRSAYKLSVLRALWTFALIDLGFRIWGFEKTFRWISGAGTKPPRAAAEISDNEVDSIFSTVQRANRLYYRRRLDCLPKALATYRFLRLRRIPVELCIGVAKYPFAGHAWVEYEGRILDEKPYRVRFFTVLKRLA